MTNVDRQKTPTNLGRINITGSLVEIKDGPDEPTNPVLHTGTRHANKMGFQLQHTQPPGTPPLHPGGLLAAVEDGEPANGGDGGRIVEFPATTTDASGAQDAVATNRAAGGSGDNATTREQAVSHAPEERDCLSFSFHFRECQQTVTLPS